MKYLYVLCVIVLTGCGECDQSKYYQIRSRDPINSTSSMCRFEADGIGMCTTWQKTQVIFFTDSCRFFKVSQIVNRDIIEKYK